MHVRDVAAQGAAESKAGITGRSMETEHEINGQAARRAFKTKTGSQMDKMVLVVMAGFSDEQGDCGLSVSEIASHSILSDLAVEVSLQRLEHFGHISKKLPACAGLPVIWRVGVACER